MVANERLITWQMEVGNHWIVLNVTLTFVQMWAKAFEFSLTPFDIAGGVMKMAIALIDESGLQRGDVASVSILGLHTEITLKTGAVHTVATPGAIVRQEVIC